MGEATHVAEVGASGSLFTCAKRIEVCECQECAVKRAAPPPTDAMRAQWAAMGLELVKTPQPTTRQAYKESLRLF